MPNHDDLEERMRAELKRQSEEAARETDEELEKDLKALKEATSSDLEKLKPKIADQATYDKLIAAVNEATANNESLAQFKQRLEALGSSVLDISKEAMKLLKGL
ncbi:MAG: hypothetical protein GY839_13705 [candidate division Zixibacteria bacterium]|nr:hypothetical protein [candidate division Zixibacteria bacterium]